MPHLSVRNHDMNRPTLLPLTLLLFSVPAAAQSSSGVRPREELTTGFLDRSLNRINLVQDRFPTLRGDSLRVSVKEQAFDTSDIDLRGRIFASGRAATSFTAHAAIMTTIIAGGGNSSPFSLGAAPAALVTSTTFASLFPEPDSFYRVPGISVQNHSYGSIVESLYGAEAAAYDTLAHNNPTLCLVFSSGNSGGASAPAGRYASLAGWANLTGNFKSAKNVLVVGATDSLGVLEGPSSRGPAHDGRVKPELTAFGQDGSSGSAALVSGTALLLQQAYKRQQGFLPPTSLLRAALINSAEDAGTPNVDYQNGYGRLNAFDALTTLQEARYRVDSIVQGAQWTQNITVPAGISRLRVTVAWNDLPAAPNNATALVNDLDLQVTDAALLTYQPWVLNPAPNAAALSQPAQRGTDTLNNQEQVTIDNPAAGNFSIKLSGTRVSGHQVFSVAWQLDTADRFRWTYPSASDPVVAGSRTVLRWLSNRSSTGTLEWSLDGGPWQPVAGAVPAQSLFYVWQAPDTTGLLRLRFRSAGFPDVISDETVISRTVDLRTGFNCTDSFLLNWSPVAPGNYRLYELGDRYLTPVAATTDTFALLRKTNHPSLYYAVAPIVNGREGQRSYTLKYDAQGVECYFRSFYLSAQAGDSAEFNASIGTAFGVSALRLQRLEGSGYQTRTTIAPVTTTSFVLNDTGLHEGINWYRLQLTLANGAVIQSEPVSVYYFPRLPVLLFPNPVPTGRSITLLSSDPGRYSVQVIDMQGRKLYERSINGLNNGLLLPVLPAGVYVVRVTSESGVLDTRKVVVY
ncbi:MAG: T9SS type A sorting domain-containing protein [Chitinophagaceae bacterium]|nr:MAG: T9SS type A sorting domain-containing protein [Chitinophagaceae bacterium]